MGESGPKNPPLGMLKVTIYFFTYLLVHDCIETLNNYYLKQKF